MPQMIDTLLKEQVSKACQTSYREEADQFDQQTQFSSKISALEEQIELFKQQFELLQKRAEEYQNQYLEQLDVVCLKEEEIRKLKERLEQQTTENFNHSKVQVEISEDIDQTKSLCHAPEYEDGGITLLDSDSPTPASQHRMRVHEREQTIVSSDQIFAIDESDRWLKCVQQNQKESSRQSSVTGDRWPPANKASSQEIPQAKQI